MSTITFAPHGEMGDRTVTLQPTSEDSKLPGKVLTVRFGINTKVTENEDGSTTEKKSGVWQVEMPTVVEGIESTVERRGAKIDKAIEMLVNQWAKPFGMSFDDFILDADFDDEFFKQKYAAPKVDKSDIWREGGMSEDEAAKLTEARSNAEGLLEAVSESSQETQSQRVALAQILLSVYNSDTIGQDMKKLQAWTRGGSDGANQVQLVKLGRGANALREAMAFATVSDTLLSIAAYSLTSGKALIEHGRRSVDHIVKETLEGKLRLLNAPEYAFPNQVTDKDGNVTQTDLPDAATLAAMLRHVAVTALGIDAAGYGDDGEALNDLATVVDAVDGKAASMVTEFTNEYGKGVDHQNPLEYAASKLTYGACRLSAAGDGIFGEAVDMVSTLADANEGDERNAALMAIFAKTRGNALLKGMTDAIKSHTKKVAAEKVARDALKADDNEPSKNAVNSFAKMDDVAAAAHVAKLILSRKDRSRVWGLVQSQVRLQIADLDKADMKVAAE